MEEADIGLSFESDNEESITAADILEIMEETWMNEKLAPELLQSKAEVVDCLYMQVNEMEKNIEKLERSDIRRAAHELELDRIKFILSNYLRLRLLKIETYTQLILVQEEERVRKGEDPFLSENEKVFALTYKNHLDRYTDDVFKFIPGYVPDESKEHPMKPNLNTFVFFESKKAIDGIMLDVTDNNQEDLVDVQSNSRMLMSYSSIEGLLKKGDVKLL